MERDCGACAVLLSPVVGGVEALPACACGALARGSSSAAGVRLCELVVFAREEADDEREVDAGEAESLLVLCEDDEVRRRGAAFVSCSWLLLGVVVSDFERAVVRDRDCAGLACSVLPESSVVSFMKKTPFYQMMRHDWRRKSLFTAIKKVCRPSIVWGGDRPSRVQCQACIRLRSLASDYGYRIIVDRSANIRLHLPWIRGAVSLLRVEKKRYIVQSSSNLPIGFRIE